MVTVPSGETRCHAPPLAVTMGEPAGIGGEIALKAWLALWRDGIAGESGPPCFFMLDDADRLAAEAARCGLSVPVIAIAAPAEAAAAVRRGVPVLHRPLPAAAIPGRPATATAPAVIAAIEQAVALVRTGAAGAVVTNPIQKAVLHDAGFAHPGHTEFLAALAAAPGAARPRPVMMLAVPGLRVIPVTVHIPLAAVPARLTTDLIVETGRIAAAALRRDVGLARPRLAVAGLNPHAGEGGHLGSEDETVIRPAVARLQADGLAVTGPLPADTLFHAAARQRYDVALCQYHDQALIPIKTLDFDRGVNLTLGLPFVRTSPDHGTALDIAGRGVASAASLIEALLLAGRMARHRAAGCQPGMPGMTAGGPDRAARHG